jgi:hypothetical protein
MVGGCTVCLFRLQIILSALRPRFSGSALFSPDSSPRTGLRRRPTFRHLDAVLRLPCLSHPRGDDEFRHSAARSCYCSRCRRRPRFPRRFAQALVRSLRVPREERTEADCVQMVWRTRLPSVVSINCSRNALGTQFRDAAGMRVRPLDIRQQLHRLTPETHRAGRGRMRYPTQRGLGLGSVGQRQPPSTAL